MPFVGEVEKKVHDRTLNKNAKYNSKTWKQCSPEAKKLTQALLCKNHEKRLPIDDILKHNWLENQDENNK